MRRFLESDRNRSLRPTDSIAQVRCTGMAPKGAILFFFSGVGSYSDVFNEKPAQVIVGHWEDFFRSQTLPTQVSIATDLGEFRESLKKSLPASPGWVMPLPRTTFRFGESRSHASPQP